MNVRKSIFLISILASTTACITMLKTNKANSAKEYSEDLAAYLPEDPIDTTTVETAENEQSTIDTTFIITARLDSALLLVNNYNNEEDRYIEGLTIQLFSGQNRVDAKDVQLRAFRYFPDSKPQLIFDQPNYKVRMEEFYSQLEAYPVFKSVQAKFSKAILVPTRIKVITK